MKRIQALIISLLFLMTNNIQASFLQGPNPYSFGPQGRSVSDLRDFAKPKSMARILPNRPVVATDSSGSRVYYTPDGKLALSIAKDGSMSFSLSGVTKSYNSDGEIKNVSRTLKGKGLLQELKNDKDEIIGYKALNGDGKVSRTYDKDMNLTSTYVYKGQGAKIDYVQNEMTKERTYYDDYGREMCIKNFDGYILKTFLYTDVQYTADENDDSRMTLKATKTDSNTTNVGLLVSVREFVAKPTVVDKKYDEETGIRSGKVETERFAYSETFFDLEGKTLYINGADGYTTREYHYKQDKKGNKILDYHLDTLTKNKTYYDEHGTASYTVNDKDSVITRYFDGYTVNVRDGFVTEVTRYDIDGKELYTTLKNIEYDTDGTIKKVIDTEEDGDDNVWHEYFYTTDKDGKKIVDYVINHSDSEFGKDTYTWYEEGKPVYTTDSSVRPVDDKAANILKDFSWNGDILVYTFDRKTETTQWYNMNKELVYISFNERVISKNIYNKGQLVGKWNAQKGETTIYINERSWITVTSDIEPTAAMITALISHSSEINADISRHDEANLANKLMDTFGWKMGASLKLLTEGEN